MPRIIYRARRDIPNAVRALHSLSPTEIQEWVLSKFNKEITPESVTMWFKRNPEVRNELEKEVISEELPLLEVRESIFKTGTFEKLDSIEVWIGDMRGRELDDKTLNGHISTMKRVCQGILPLTNPETQKGYRKGQVAELRKQGIKIGIDLKEKGWTLRHPDRFNLEDSRELIRLVKQHYPKVDLATWNMTMRNFLESKGIHVGKKISGAKHKSAGKYAKLFVEKKTLYDMINFAREINYIAGCVDNFMFKTATRIDATIRASLDDFRILPLMVMDEKTGEMKKVGESYELTVFDKGRKSKYPRGHPWDKYLPVDVFEEIKLLTGYPKKKTGIIFDISKDEMTEINNLAIEKYYPELWEKYPIYDDVNHFWRHMFAQHMLRATGWNYAIVAFLGGWTVKSLEESYGQPPPEQVKEWGLQRLPSLNL